MSKRRTSQHHLSAALAKLQPDFANGLLTSICATCRLNASYVLYVYYLCIKIQPKMIFLNTDIATEELRRKFKNLSKAQTRKSVFRALNQTINQGRVEMSKQIRSVYNISAADIAQRDKVNPARVGFTDDRAELLYNTRPLSLAAFSPKEVNNGVVIKFFGSKSKGGFKVANTRIKQEGTYITIIKGQQKLLRSAFLNIRDRNNSGQKQAGASALLKAFGRYNAGGFQFNPKSRATTLKTKSVFFMAISDTVLKAGSTKMKGVYYTNLVRQISRGFKYGS